MYNRNLLGLFGMFSLGAVSLAAIPAQAQLASQSSQFTGTVPALCRVADAVNATTAMTYANNTLSGTTNPFSFESNGNVSLQLRAVEIVGAPSGSESYNWAAGLRVNNGAQLAQATQNGASSAVPYANGLTANDDFQMTLAIANGGNMLAQGTYIANVTTDCIAP
jgi:hypothetical protein